MELDLNIVVLAVLTSIVGYLMALAGVQKSALEWRRRKRTCPSCGRDITGNTCGCTASS
jgi:hypothetical protein